MSFNPDIHHRRSLRLQGYDYAAGGVYFVTICTWERECLFGDVVAGEIRLNGYGATVVDCWQAIALHFPLAELDEFVIMPNHLHGIILLNDSRSSVGAQHAAPLILFERSGRAQHAAPLQRQQPLGVVSGSIGAIVHSFKSAVTKRINAVRANAGGPVWQRNYYERVIRDEHELNRVREYIMTNPPGWDNDVNNLYLNPPTNS